MGNETFETNCINRKAFCRNNPFNPYTLNPQPNIVRPYGKCSGGYYSTPVSSSVKRVLSFLVPLSINIWFYVNLCEIASWPL